MERPFNLTKCKKLSLRRRTLCGTTSWYHTYYEPLGLNHADRRIAIDSFKHPHTAEEKATSDGMIRYSMDEFLKVHDINESA